MRQMEVPAVWVATRETGALPKMIGADIEPSEARELQGTMFFAFPDLEAQDKRIFDMPGVVDWLAVLHERIPHLIYFLDPTPSLGALEGLILTFLPHDERRRAVASGAIPVTDKIYAALTDRLIACATFATAKGDDWEPIVARFVEPLGRDAEMFLKRAVRDSPD